MTQNPSKTKELKRAQTTGTASDRTKILRQAMQLAPGERAAIPAPEAVVRAAVPLRIKAKQAMFHIVPVAGAVEVQRLHWVDEPPSVRARIKAMQDGDTLRLDEANLSAVRSTASQLSAGTGLRYTVKPDDAGGVAIWCRSKDDDQVEPAKARTGPAPRYPFADQAPGTSFTAPAGAHAGIAAMRTQCARHGASMKRVFQARENIDGSITVRCFAIGGMPPKWAVDRDHAQVQEAIERQRQPQRQQQQP